MLCLFGFSVVLCVLIFFFKQKTAYEMRISDWSSDVCSSDLGVGAAREPIDDLPLALVAPLRPDDGNICHDAVLLSGREKPGAALADLAGEIGRASCRERVCQYV